MGSRLSMAVVFIRRWKIGHRDTATQRKPCKDDCSYQSDACQPRNAKDRWPAAEARRKVQRSMVFRTV